MHCLLASSLRVSDLFVVTCHQVVNYGTSYLRRICCPLSDEEIQDSVRLHREIIDLAHPPASDSVTDTKACFFLVALSKDALKCAKGIQASLRQQAPIGLVSFVISILQGNTVVRVWVHSVSLLA